MALQAQLRQEANQDLIGQTMAVLVDGPSSEHEYLLEGRHEGQAPGIDGKVILTNGTAERGDLVRAVVTQADAHDLVASLDPTAVDLDDDDLDDDE